MQVITNDYKITINPYLEIVYDNLIEDLKIFSIVIAQDEQNLNNLFNKDSLTISEIKFCIAIGILSERLEYYNTSLKFYSKVLLHCFSLNINYRKISIYFKLKDFKACFIQILNILSLIPKDGLLNFTISPIWLDKILLDLLSEVSYNDLFSYIPNPPKYVTEYLVKIIKKYYNWISLGHDIHIIKE